MSEESKLSAYIKTTEYLNAIYNALKNSVPSLLDNIFPTLERVIKAYSEIYPINWEEFDELPEEYKDLLLYFLGEFNRMIEFDEIPEEYKGMTAKELLLTGYKAEGALKEVFKIAYNRAKDAEIIAQQTFQTMEEESQENIEERKEKAPHVSSVNVIKPIYPLDKISFLLWSLNIQNWDLLLKEGLEIVTTSEEDEKDGKEAIIDLKLNFDEIENKFQSMKLNEFDKRVYIAYCSLYISGNKTFSVSQIYAEMGHTSKPSSEVIKKINESLSKMGSAVLILDNSKEISVNKSTPLIKIVSDKRFLPFDREAYYINNVYCDSAIVPLGIPPLLKFTIDRKQFSYINRETLQTPVDKTNMHLAIEHYLLYRISRMKNKDNKRPIKKILFSKVFERAQIPPDRRYKARAKTTIFNILDHYKKIGDIKGYTVLEDGVNIILHKQSY